MKQWLKEYAIHIIAAIAIAGAAAATGMKAADVQKAACGPAPAGP